MKPSDTTEVGPGTGVGARARRRPQRTCVGCRQSAPRGQLVRVVCGPTGRLVVDPAGTLPGRGAYLCPRRRCVAQALKGARLREALRHEVVAAPLEELVQELLNALKGRAIACVHLARKAGRAVSGYTQVMRALAHAPVAFVLMAEDAVPERRRAYTMWCEKRQIPARPFLTKTGLGALVGREESSAIGILDPHLSERLGFYLEGMRGLTER